MRQPLPWESVEPPIYVSRVPKPRKKWVTVGGWLLVALLLLGGLTTKYKIALVFAVLYTLTLLTQKEAAVTTRGLEIFYQMQITTHYDFFSWERITSIVREDRDHPDFIRLHFGFEATEKALFFTRADAAGVEKLAKMKNPAIRIVDYEGAQKAQPKRKR